MRRFIVVSSLTLATAGCATQPLPDGSKVLRLPESSAPPAPLTPEESRRLAELNAQVLREQDAARAREERIEALRSAPPPYAWSPAWAVPYPYFDGGWVWTGHRWQWRPRWGLGFGWYGAWPY